MGDVAMAWLRLVVIFQPFLKLAELADLEVRQPIAGSGDIPGEIWIDAEDTGGANHPRKQGSRDFSIHVRSHRKLCDHAFGGAEVVLRRNRWAGHKLIV